MPKRGQGCTSAAVLVCIQLWAAGREGHNLLPLMCHKPLACSCEPGVRVGPSERHERILYLCCGGEVRPAVAAGGKGPGLLPGRPGREPVPALTGQVSATVSAVEHGQGVGGEAVPAVVADEVGVLQLQVEGDVAWQRLRVSCNATLPSARQCLHACRVQIGALRRCSWVHCVRKAYKLLVAGQSRTTRKGRRCMLHDRLRTGPCKDCHTMQRHRATMRCHGSWWRLHHYSKPSVRFEGPSMDSRMSRSPTKSPTLRPLPIASVSRAP